MLHEDDGVLHREATHMTIRVMNPALQQWFLTVLSLTHVSIVTTDATLATTARRVEQL